VRRGPSLSFMTSVEAVDPAEVASTPTPAPPPRRRRWIPVTIVVALLVGIAAWQGVARIGRVETGSASNGGAGMALPSCVPSGDMWAMFGSEEDVVVVQTVRNPSPWPVTVTSTEPDVVRFEPVSDDPMGDLLLDKDPRDGAPDTTVEQVVIPAGREAPMWIVDPLRGRNTEDERGSWYGRFGTPVTLGSLGVERTVYVEFPGGLYIGGIPDTTELGEALEEACEG
jgi:hypothetical protein